jgi:hypothetical protein
VPSLADQPASFAGAGADFARGTASLVNTLAGWVPAGSQKLLAW